MVRIRSDHLAAAAKDGRMSCAANDYVLKFLSELWKDMNATAASKDSPAEIRPQIKVKQRGNEDGGDCGEYGRFYESDDYTVDGPYSF